MPDENAKYIVAIFERYKSSSNLTDVMIYMREEFGVNRTPATYRKSILKNRIYIGEYRGNKTYCEPIIDRETFDLVQILLSKNIRSNKKNDYIFSGIIRCGECGGALTASQIHNVGHPRIDGTRKKYKRSGYRCKRHFDLKLCDNKKIVLENAFEKYLISNLREKLEKYIAEYETSTAPSVNINAKKKQLKNKISKLKELYVNDLISIDEFKIDRSKYLEKINSLPDADAEKKDLEPIKKLLNENIEEIYATFNVNEKIRFWRGIVQEVRFYSDRSFEIIFL